MTKKKDDRPRGEAAPWKDGRKPAVTCSARTTAGFPCKRPPIKGSNVCRAHGGAAPQVRAAAQVRILMSADAAAAKLIEMIHSKKVADNVKLAAVRDLLDRANLSGTQNIEVGVTKRSFEDVTSDVVMDLFMGDMDIVDAEVIEEDDNSPLVPRAIDGVPPALTRGDRNFEAVVERGRRAEVQRMRSGGMSDTERARREAEAFAEAPASSNSRGRAAYLAALDAGKSHDDAERAAQRAVDGVDPSERGRARTSEASITTRRSKR